LLFNGQLSMFPVGWTTREDVDCSKKPVLAAQYNWVS